ncbi:MAG: sensor histidine kinase [Terriglobia bacterium]|jgi:signal transduction histidine kinase
MSSQDRSDGLEAGEPDREYFLAYACLALGFACIITGYLDPAVLGKHASLSRLLIFAYFTYGLLNLTIVLVSKDYRLMWQLSSHAAGIILASLIITFTGGVNSAFLTLYFFALLAAASRWGVIGTLPTACACMFIMWLDVFAPISWSDRMWRLTKGSTYFNGIRALLVLSAYFLGLLMQREKKRYADAVVISRLIRRALPESSLRATIGTILQSLREHLDADQVRLVMQEVRGEQAFAWEARRPIGKDANGVQSWRLTGPARQASFAAPPERIRRLLGLRRVGGDDRLHTAVLSRQKGGLQSALTSVLGWFLPPSQYNDELYDMRIVNEQHVQFGGFCALLVTSFSLGGKWFGRLTVYNPHKGRDRRGNARFLAVLVREVGPAVYNKYLVGRLRSRAQAKERARLAQDLHDGVIQSLMGMEMQIDLLRRTQEAPTNPSYPVLELRRVQDLLHNEIADLREEMQRVRPLEVEPARLLDCMAGMVDRFRRDLGISASFVAESQEVSLPPRVCTELVRIVQEALANVRKHSGAHKVLVRFVRENGHWKLCVEDDGQGFGFTGRLSSADLEASSQCPLVIKERVRAIGGELMVESVQGSGTRLEILVPLSANG